MLQGDDKWGAFYAVGVFFLPSHQENCSIVVAEALACGKPVLISNKVNIWREIEEGTAEGTVRNFKRWLALDNTAYTEMGQRAKQYFTQRFHITSAAERLIQIIRDHC